MEIFYIILGVVLLAALVFVFFTKIASLTIVLITAVVALLLPLPVYGITTTIAKNDQETFNEFWNGSELSTEAESRVCQRDGICVNTFQCDPYIVYETEYYTDSEGKRQPRQVAVTKYHDCPYSTEETTYLISTTLGAYSAGSNLMTGEPFRWGHNIPGGQVTTPPQLWLDAKARIENGTPGGVTKVNQYKNYILAADYTLFKEYSDEIEKLKADGYLKPPASGVENLYQAVKVYSYGVKIPESYVSDVQNLNAKFGAELHGDLHMVFVPANKVGDSTNYANALKAYWTSPEMGDNAIAKNSVTIVVGVNGSESKWAKMFTGMPVGNEALENQISNELKNLPLDENFIGNPVFNIDKGTYSSSDGKVESILFGANKFERVSMSAEGEDDSGTGFKYLSEAWIPDEGTMGWVYGISIFLILVALGVGGMLSFKNNDFDPVGTFLHKKGN